MHLSLILEAALILSPFVHFLLNCIIRCIKFVERLYNTGLMFSLYSILNVNELILQHLGLCVD